MNLDLNKLSLKELKDLQSQVAKAISGYEDRRKREALAELEEKAKAMGFSDFLAHPDTAAAFAAWPYPAYLRDAQGRERPALYARLERLEEDLVPFEAHLGFRLTPLTPANASKRARDWRGYYSDADAQRLATICAADIARFGYGFDPDPV